MITIFKNNDLVNIFLLLPYTILLRVHGIIYPTAYKLNEGDTLVSKWLLSDVLTSPLLQVIIALLLVYGQGVLINMMVNGHRLYRIPSSLSGMCYILLVSALPELQVLSPALIGMTFVLVASFSVFNTYKQSSATAGIFNAALSGAVAVLFYPPYAILFIAFIIGLSMLRSFDLKEKLQFILGYLVPFWILGGSFYAFGWLNFSILEEVDFPGTLTEIFSPKYYVTWAVLILAAIAIFNYFNYKKKKVIEVRKKIDFLYWSMASAFMAVILFSGLQIQHVLYMSFGLSVFLGMSLADMRSTFLAEIIHIIFLGVVFAIQYVI